MSKRIYLTQNKFTIVSDDDYECLIQYKWCYHSGYVDRSTYKETQLYTKELLHRKIMENILNRKLEKTEFVDHINHVTLDNRRENLRICSVITNGYNRVISSNNQSGYKGVYYIPRIKMWHARIQANKQRIFLGYYKTPELAARAYDNAALKYHGEFANLNFPIS